MLGFLPPSSRATFLTVGRGRCGDPPTGLEAAGEGDHVDPGVGRERRTCGGPGAEDEVADPGRQPGLLEQAHQVDRRVRRQLARLEHEGVAGGQAGADLPRDLQQRVVPRRHQATDPDGLVDDPADHVGVAGVDHPAGLLGGDPSVVPEHRDHVGDVVLPLDEALARVERLHPGDVVGVALEEVGQPQQQVAALAARGGSPRPVDERRVGGGDGGLGVGRPGLVHLGDEGPVGRAADLPALTGERGDPCSVDVQIRHASPRVSFVAHVATGCSERNQQTFEGWCADTRSVKGDRESVTYR